MAFHGYIYRLHPLQLAERQGDAAVGQGQVHARQAVILLRQIQMQASLFQRPVQQAHPRRKRRGQAGLLRLGQQGLQQRGHRRRILRQRIGGAVHCCRCVLIPHGGVIHLVRPFGCGGFAGRSRSAPRQRQQQRACQRQKPSLVHGCSPPFSRQRGKVTAKQVPAGSLRRTVTVPRCWRAVSRTMDRPSPVPPAARERALSTR